MEQIQRDLNILVLNWNKIKKWKGQSKLMETLQEWQKNIPPVSLN